MQYSYVCEYAARYAASYVRIAMCFKFEHEEVVFLPIIELYLQRKLEKYYASKITNSS